MLMICSYLCWRVGKCLHVITAFEVFQCVMLPKIEHDIRDKCPYQYSENIFFALLESLLDSLSF